MSDERRHLPIIPGHVGYSPDFKSGPARIDPPIKIANEDGSLPPRPSKVARARDHQKRVDYYVKGYSKQTLAELIVSLEDKYGIPPATD